MRRTGQSSHGNLLQTNQPRTAEGILSLSIVLGESVYKASMKYIREKIRNKHAPPRVTNTLVNQDKQPWESKSIHLFWQIFYSKSSALPRQPIQYNKRDRQESQKQQEPRPVPLIRSPKWLNSVSQQLTCAAARAIVAIWLLSPHSPRKVRMNDWTKTGPKMPWPIFRASMRIRVNMVSAAGGSREGGERSLGHPSWLLNLILGVRRWSERPRPPSKASRDVTTPFECIPVPSTKVSVSISSSTSRISSCIFSLLSDIWRPSRSIFIPKIRNNRAAASWVYLLGIMVGRMRPIPAERADMMRRDPKAPAKTVTLSWRMARIAALPVESWRSDATQHNYWSHTIRNVLSPISDAMITEKAWHRARKPDDCSSGMVNVWVWLDVWWGTWASLFRTFRHLHSMQDLVHAYIHPCVWGNRTFQIAQGQKNRLITWFRCTSWGVRVGLLLPVNAQPSRWREQHPGEPVHNVSLYVLDRKERFWKHPDHDCGEAARSAYWHRLF